MENSEGVFNMSAPKSYQAIVYRGKDIMYARLLRMSILARNEISEADENELVVVDADIISTNGNKTHSVMLTIKTVEEA